MPKAMLHGSWLKEGNGLSQRDASTAWPIFVLGGERSGTTLLRLILNSHPEVAIGPESGFMRGVEAIRNPPRWERGAQWHHRFDLSDDELDELIRQFYGGLFSDYARAQGKVRWGEKTPLHLWDAEEIAALFPTAQFIGIIRHAGAVTASWQAWAYPHEVAVEAWLATSIELLRLHVLLGDERLMLCRYEDILLDPVPTVGRLLTFLQLSWSDDVLQHHQVLPGRSTSMVTDGGTRIDRAIDSSRLDNWSKKLSRGAREDVRQRAGRLLADLGYELATSVPKLPLNEVRAMGPAYGRDLPRQRSPLGTIDDPAVLADELTRLRRENDRLRHRRAVRLADTARALLRRHPRAGRSARFGDK